MRYLLAIFTFAAFVNAADPEWDDPRLQPDSNPLDTLPAVKELKRDAERAIVEVTNNSTKDIAYSGFGSMFQVFQKYFENGRWVAKHWDWCGTGKTTIIIPPGKSVELRVSFSNPKQREQIWSRFYSPTNQKICSFVLLAEEEH